MKKLVIEVADGTTDIYNTSDGHFVSYEIKYNGILIVTHSKYNKNGYMVAEYKDIYPRGQWLRAEWSDE